MISGDSFKILVGFKAWVEEENERRAVENAVRRIVENAVRRVEKENLVESVVNQGVDGNKFYLARTLILRRFLCNLLVRFFFHFHRIFAVDFLKRQPLLII